MESLQCTVYLLFRLLLLMYLYKGLWGFGACACMCACVRVFVHSVSALLGIFRRITVSLYSNQQHISACRTAAHWMVLVFPHHSPQTLETVVRENPRR